MKKRDSRNEVGQKLALCQSAWRTDDIILERRLARNDSRDECCVTLARKRVERVLHFIPSSLSPYASLRSPERCTHKKKKKTKSKITKVQQTTCFLGNDCDELVL